MVSATMPTMPISKKPDYYVPVSALESDVLRKQFQELTKGQASAWHNVDRRLLDLNQQYIARGRTKAPYKLLKSAYGPVWDYYDLELRAILFLSHIRGKGFNRRSLVAALDGSHGIPSEEIASYISAFPDTMFSHHCDLDWYSGSKDELRVPTVRAFDVEAVIPGAVYFVSSSDSMSPEDPHTLMSYYTVRDNKMLILDTWDYEEVLKEDNDGLCYYIQ